AENTDRNELFASTTLNGRLVLKGDFDAITGEKLLTALSPLTEPHPAVDGSQDDRSPARRRADAFGHILDQYLASNDRPIEGGERPHVNLHIRLQDLTDLQSRGDEDDITDDEHCNRTRCRAYRRSRHVSRLVRRRHHCRLGAVDGTALPQHLPSVGV
ncbi:DUF222 domain-containing protein, partial [Rhodococcus sp. NPDC006774]|uniref:DUF222 domain-containing protein n=1 Tax=Rhodococcus sp. NPDC006774 TaxID=3157186 RepID=UPI0034117173